MKKQYTITIIEAQQMLGAIRRVMAEKMPAKLSFRMSKNALLLANHADLQAADEVRKGIIGKYGVSDPEGNVQVPQDKMKDFFAEYLNEYEPVLKQKIDVGLETFTEADLDHFPAVGNDMELLAPLIVE
jgi:hypothetical protein